MRYWTRSPKPVVVSEKEHVWGDETRHTWWTVHQLQLCGTHLALDIAKDGSVLVAGNGLHVADGTVLRLDLGIGRLVRLGLANTEKTVSVTSNGKTVRTADLSKSGLVDDTSRDKGLGLEV